MSATHVNTSAADAITVSFPGFGGGSGGEQTLRFSESFRIGRSDACQVRIASDVVSRVHAEVVREGGEWRIRDLGSSNGLYLNGSPVASAPLASGTVIRLGIEGPALSFALPAAESAETIVARYADRYFRKDKREQPIGEHTMYVRLAYAKVQTRQKRRYGGVIALLLAASLAVSAYAFFLHRQVARQRAIASDLFYSIKSLDVEIALLEQSMAASGGGSATEVVNKYEARRGEMEKNYDRFLATLHVYDAKKTEQQKLILRIARVFGECELDMPPDFIEEVNRYIGYWQSSGRFAYDVSLARQKGYTRSIPQALLAEGLPAQFFYLAMQESDFNPYASGAPTRKGIAKGMWQFIPETGAKYGLRIGPLVDLPRPDPGDERDQQDKATRAAAQYLKMLYSTDAQASGLLVMACYNWGEDQVLPLVRSMPLNPRERNFWRLLAEHRSQIPKQTYDYVFYITSAAVIGENPRLFGFDFDNPLLEPAAGDEGRQESK